MKDLKKEIKTYKGVEYALVLCADDDEAKPASWEKVDEKQWWNLEPTLKSQKFYERFLILWADAREMKDARMKDKYHTMELEAMRQIDWVIDKGLSSRAKFMWKETIFSLKILLLVTWILKEKIKKIWQGKQTL